ncbi:hypothetical protein [Flavimarina sp. Hel_I_48]|uniref:hypothetical protein n=1 Tax=Flavimarina sp. Hel_I_48 TaxID=1392488 RepID=UPI0004DFA3DE|nr:hypothetical protein [Flavimarina sp. Hel_I_48]
MNKIISLFLTIIFAFNILGPILLFKVHQYEVRKQSILRIKKGLPDAHLAQIAVGRENSKHLLWLGDDEFRYRGKMYDVVRAQQVNNGNIIYYCYAGSQESFLYSRLSKHLKDAKKNKKNRSLTAKITFKYLSRKNTYTVIEDQEFSIDHIRSFFNYSSHYSSPTLKISAPPPKVV